MAAIGFVLSQEQFIITELVELGVLAEQAGFDMVWSSDHFHPWQHNQGHSGQAWLTLAAIGQRTQRIHMGTGVTCPTYRYHPATVAQSFASLGILYPGRVFLGVGTGEAVNEEAATGGWGDYDERSERLIEAVQLIRDLWTGEVVNHQGRYYQTRDARLYDVPSQPVPLYIAAGGENSMSLAGQHGDGLITDGEMAKNDQMRRAFETGARGVGKDPDKLSVHAELFVFVGTREQARSAAEKWLFIAKAWDKYVDIHDPRTIMTDAQQNVSVDTVLDSWIIGEGADAHIQAIRELEEAGVTHVYVHSAQDDQRRFMDFYARQVLPQVQHSIETLSL